jgi:hypothetical protein
MSQVSPGHDEDADGEPEVTWVGQQWRMDGYCGRATQAQSPPAPPPVAPELVRPVAVVRTRPSQGRVVRIGPPKAVANSPAA